MQNFSKENVNSIRDKKERGVRKKLRKLEENVATKIPLEKCWNFSKAVERMLQPRYAGEMLNSCPVPRPWGGKSSAQWHLVSHSASSRVLWYSRPPGHCTVVICHYIFTSWILRNKQASFGTGHLPTKLHVSWSEQLELEELRDFLVMEDAQHYGWCAGKCIRHSSTSCGWCCSHSGIVMKNQHKWY